MAFRGSSCESGKKISTLTPRHAASACQEGRFSATSNFGGMGYLSHAISVEFMAVDMPTSYRRAFVSDRKPPGGGTALGELAGERSSSRQLHGDGAWSPRAGRLRSLLSPRLS